MKKEQANTKMDIFRMAAAYLVVAIHTAPFSSVNGTQDSMQGNCQTVLESGVEI